MTTKPAYRTAVRVWIALLGLLALTCGSAFIPMGAWNTAANFLIAGMKALLVGAFFMHLLNARVYRAVVVTATFILSLLLGLSLADYATRTTYSTPWQTPRGSTPRSGSEEITMTAWRVVSIRNLACSLQKRA